MLTFFLLFNRIWRISLTASTKEIEMTRHYLCFEILYWRGIREGELLVLTPEDIDISKKNDINYKNLSSS